jgi:hypothetical protein
LRLGGLLPTQLLGLRGSLALDAIRGQFWLFLMIPHLYDDEVVGLHTVDNNNIAFLYPFLPKHTGKHLNLIK